MVAEVRGEYPHETAALRHVAGLLVINPGTLRLWVNGAQADAGNGPGATTDKAEEIKRLRREVAEPKWANEILKAASVFCQGVRPSHGEMIRFIDEHHDQFAGRVPSAGFCARQFLVYPSRGCCGAKARLQSARVEGELRVPEIARLHAENNGVHGVRKMMPCCVAGAGMSGGTRPRG